MTNLTTLLSPNEVIHYTGLPKTFPVCDVRNIFTIEYCEFSECLGIGFYEELKENLADYSDALKWEKDTAYVKGDKVIWRGTIKCALKDNNNTSPDTKGCWGFAPKFSKPCLENFWCMFLAPYLSWIVLRKRIPFIANQIQADGILEMFGFGARFKTVEGDRIHMVIKAIASEIERSFKALKYYARKNNSEGCFDNIKFIGATCCKECGGCECFCEDVSCDDDKSDTGYVVNIE